MQKTLSRNTSGPKGGAGAKGPPRPQSHFKDETRPKNAARPQKESRPKSRPQPKGEAREGDRIAKVMARAGLCSRRDAEAWITQGRVAVNGKVLQSPALNVSATDQISVDGQLLTQRQRTRLFLFHKPRGLVTTHKDPEGRPTIFDYLHDHATDAPRLISVGRLDINTEGLLLLTNDGGLARILELPTTGWLRRYRVRANGETHQAVLDELAKGVTIEGVRYAGIDATFERQQGANCWLTMGLREGKNREIKRVLEHLGLTVNRLIRISFGPFQLGDLLEGKIDEVRTRVLRDQLGTALAQAAGCDFDTPIEMPAPEMGEGRAPSTAPQRSRSARSDSRPKSDRSNNRSKSDRSGADRPKSDRSPGGRQAPRAKRAEPEPELKHRPAPGPRKHISTLRAKPAGSETGRRQRIETGETTDRKGRAVTVERRVDAKPATTDAAKSGRRSNWKQGQATAEANRKPRANDRDPARGKTRGYLGPKPPRAASNKKPHAAGPKGPRGKR